MKKLFLLATTLMFVTGCQTINNLITDIENYDYPSFGSKPVESETFIAGADCPVVEVVEELSSYSEFTDFSRPTPDNLLSKFYVASADSTCTFNGKTMTVDLNLAFEGSLGNAGASKGPSLVESYPFFVAVVSPAREIMAKEVFSASVTYKGSGSVTHRENIRQIIPVPDRDTGRSYKVMAGFQLTPEQLAYNRDLISLTKVEYESEFSGNNQVIEIRRAE